MIQYVLAGLVLGGIYAIAAAGLVITYESTGILNFAFGSLAYAIARFYYYLHVQKEWTIVPAAVASIVVAAPLLGLVLYVVLFRFLRQSSSLIKVVATIGLSVTLPALALLLFGNEVILLAPGLAPQPVQVVHVAGVAITMDQIIVYACVVATVVLGALVLRFTDVGLRVRALVDSEAMTALSGTSPGAVSAGVWAVSTLFAGLAGVLAAPIIGLQPTNFTLLIASAFAAVIAAKLRSLPVAVTVGLAIGVTGSLVERYMPQGSSLTAAVIPSIPFAFILVFLVLHARRGRVSEGDGVGGALDRAIRPQGAGASPLERHMEHQPESVGEVGRSSPVTTKVVDAAGRYTGPALLVIAVLLLPLVLDDFWVGLIAEGIAFAVIFLAYTLVTGEGGMIWLCQVTFAGVGALTTAQLATVHGWPVLAAIAASGALAACMGVAIGFLTIRLGDLYVALVTLTFGLLMETLVFSRDMFLKFGVGVSVPRPSFAETNVGFAYMVLAVFFVVAVFIVHLRRSTPGMALNAVRWSEAGARTIGVSPLQMKVLVSGLAAFVAGVGGGFLASYLKAALPVDYATITGTVWLAILVGLGARSTLAALVAGLTFTLFPEIVSRNFPESFAQVPPLLFGLTAIVVARHPDGALQMQGDQFRALLARLSPRRATPVAATGTQAAALVPRAPTAVHAASSPRPDTHPVILEASDVTVRFGGLLALSDVGVAVRAGTVAGLVGPNGAGKTTLFAVLSGMLRAETGRVRLAGVDVTAASPQARARKGLARTFQQPELFMGLTVREHLVLARRAHLARRRLWIDLVRVREASDPEEDRDVDGLVELLGLARVADAPVSGLPLGTTRRVEVARALASAPSVVLLDEPSSGLDGRETRQLAHALERVVEERSVALLLVEHDVDMVLSLSSEVFALDFGILIAHGTADEIRAHPKVRAAYLGDAPTPNARTPEQVSR